MSKKTFDIEEIRSKVLDTDDREFGSVYVEQWDADLPTISLSMKQRKRVRQKAIKVLDNGSMKVDSETMQIQGMIEGCRNHKDGKQIFSQGDAKQLWEKNSNAVGKVGNKILQDSDMDKDGDEQVEEAKNS